MPYLQVDLDAVDEFGAVALQTGISEGDVAVGVLKLWRWAWKEKATHASRERVAAFFPREAHDIHAALVVCGFLEAPSSRLDFRIRGAEKRLGITEAQVKAGKQHAGNLKRGQNSPGPLRVDPGPLPAPPPASDRLLHPASSIQHPALEALAPASPPPAPKKPPNPALKRLTDRLASVFLEERGVQYHHGGAKDAEALKRIDAEEDAVVLLWRRGLGAQGWLRVNSFAQLGAKWNDLVDDARRRSA